MKRMLGKSPKGGYCCRQCSGNPNKKRMRRMARAFEADQWRRDPEAA